MTEETQQSEDAVQTDASVPNDNCPPVQSDAQINSSDSAKTKDIKREKCRPQTKVVIRRLPPTMTQEQFIEQVSPLPEHDYFHFSKADMSLGQFAFCRAYINFVDQKDIFVFQEKFDNYIFIDSKGVEYPAVVEFAPFQRLPKKRPGKKKDLKCGTIESDPYYISFLDSLKNQEVDPSTTQSKTEYSYQPPDNTAKKVVTTTPLLEYLKLRKQEKQRIKDEKREERRKRDLERRRTKDDAVISKFLRNLDVDKESRDDKENKDERDKFSPKDMKNRIKRDEKIREKSLRDRETKPIIKGYRDRVDDRNKEREIKQRRYDEKKPYGRRDEREVAREERRYDLKDDRRYETKEEFRECKDRKVEERRGKSYEKMRQEKKKLAEMKKQIADANGDDASSTKVKEERDTIQKEEDRNNTESVLNEDDSKSAGDNECEQRETTEDRIADATQTTCQDGTEEENGPINTDANEEASEEKEPKVVKRRNSLESSSEGGAGDGSCLRRHKSLDGGGQSDLQKNENEEKEKDKKDPRLERRIRNKDRPAMEIYRPGMGKFSKQRMEREKSSNDDRASLSQSPTPNSSSQTNKSGKSGTTEVRSMTFKRSFARDAA